MLPSALSISVAVAPSGSSQFLVAPSRSLGGSAAHGARGGPHLCPPFTVAALTMLSLGAHAADLTVPREGGRGQVGEGRRLDGEDWEEFQG